MSLSGTLGIALSGLNLTQAQLDLVARNVANADTPGYTAKSVLPVARFSGSDISGVVIGEIQRDVDLFIQQQLRTETSVGVGTQTRVDFLSRLDQLFGKPGEANALDSVVNEFGNVLQALATSPEQVGAREAAIAQAVTLADHLNQLSGDIQTMRREAESSLAIAVDEINIALGEIARLNVEIQAASNSGVSIVDLQDQRDASIDRLAEFLDVRTADGELGAVRVFTTGGNLLVDNQAAVLSFDERSNLDATALYSTDDAERGVGTLTLKSANGADIDLFKHGVIHSGKIAALKDLRDVTLVDAQAQLDELAHGLALAMSTIENTGSAVTVGAATGFDLDIAGLQAGNPITVTFTDTPPGTEQTMTFVRVDDPSILPLDNSVTSNPNDLVVGIDFSGGLPAAIAAMDAALGPNITVSSPAADTIRIVDDGAAGLSNIGAVSAAITATATTDQGLALPLFVELTNAFNPYSGSLDGTGQKTGFASRIAVNPDILNDPSLLVAYSTSPATGSGDPARPLELLARFSERPFNFAPVRGIGSEGQPFSGTIASFTQRIVSFQGQQYASANNINEAQSIIVGALEARMDADTKVNVDEELASLLNLQNAYAANSRILSVVQELMELLLRI